MAAARSGRTVAIANRAVERVSLTCARMASHFLGAPGRWDGSKQPSSQSVFLKQIGGINEDFFSEGVGRFGGDDRRRFDPGHVDARTCGSLVSRRRRRLARRLWRLARRLWRLARRLLWRLARWLLRWLARRLWRLG